MESTINCNLQSVLLEKLIVDQLHNIFPVFYGTHYCVHKNLPLAHTLSQIKPVRIPIPY
jgi:hypothetical protein